MTEPNVAKLAPLPDYRLFVGIDIALLTFSVVVATSFEQTEPAFSLKQTASDFKALQSHLLSKGYPARQILVVMEATNTYWMKLALELYQAGFAVSVINPAQAHSFAKALLKRAKTDDLDAKVLAQLAERLRPECWSPPPAIYEELQQRLAQRDAFLEMRGQEANRMAALQERPYLVESVAEACQKLIAYLDGEVKRLEKEIKEQLASENPWQQAAARLQSIIGFGTITVGWILVGTLAFAHCPASAQAVGLAGLAPNKYQSGTSINRRASIGHSGDGRLRQALYMATLSAGRHNPQIRQFLADLEKAGKPNKVRRCAAARKLLVMGWAVVKHDKDYDPNYDPSARTRHHQKSQLA